jgi:hypothetical protein
MKKTLAVVVLAAIVSLTAVAQNAATPSLGMGHQANAAATQRQTFSWGPPPAGPNILFYGGDVNADDPNVYAFANGNTLYVPSTPTYGAVQVPAKGHFVITGIFFNQIATLSGKIFDPPTATYDIRVDVSNGYGGTSVASGSGPQSARPTGRMPLGYVEYTTSVALTSPLTAPNGQTVWVNESPQCTDLSNSICNQVQFYVDNTTQKTGSVNGGAQPAGQIFLECTFCSHNGFEWFNWCDGSNQQQCAYLSFGIYGHRQTEDGRR